MGNILGSEDSILILHNTTQTIQQVFVLDVTITCAMNFKAFPFDSQSCPFELLDIERPPVDFFTMVTSTVEFTDWPRPFSPTASEFDYEVFFYIKECSILHLQSNDALKFSGFPPQRRCIFPSGFGLEHFCCWVQLDFAKIFLQICLPLLSTNR